MSPTRRLSLEPIKTSAKARLERARDRRGARRAARPRLGRTASVRFREQMRGWVHLAGANPFAEPPVSSDPLTLSENSSRITLKLSCELDDVARFERDGATPLPAIGTVEIANPPVILDAAGTMRLAIPATTRDEGVSMEYELLCRSTPDSPAFVLSGRKYVRDDTGPFDVWSDTTRLDFVIYPEGEPRTIVGHGNVRIGISHLLGMVASMRSPRRSRRPARLADGTTTEVAPERGPALRPPVRFTWSFTKQVVGQFRGVLSTNEDFRRLAATPPLPLPDEEPDHPISHWYANGTPPRIGDDLGNIEWSSSQSDTSWLGLHRFYGGDKGPIMLAAGYGMSSDSMAARVGPTDLVTYLTDKGFDVWLFDYRQSFRLASHRSSFTMDDIALVDWPAAVEQVRRLTGADSVLIFAHCMGSMTVFMSLLGGLTGVRAFVASQVTAHVTMPAFSRLKATLRVPALMQRVGLNTVGPPRGLGIAERIWDVALRPYPWIKGERCHNPACRWVTSVYGPTHLHRNLSASAHSQIANMFGAAAVAPVGQITRIVRAGHLVDARGRDTYMQRADRLNIPIAFLRGTDNKIFTRSGPLRTIAWLRERHPDQDYEWIGIDGFGHLDALIGRDSERRVFNKILPFLERYSDAPDSNYIELRDRLEAQPQDRDGGEQTAVSTNERS